MAPLVTVSDRAVVVESVKLAEDGSGDLVARLYESLGGRARATVTADADVGSVETTDLLERPSPMGLRRRADPSSSRCGRSSW